MSKVVQIESSKAWKAKRQTEKQMRRERDRPAERNARMGAGLSSESREDRVSLLVSLYVRHTGEALRYSRVPLEVLGDDRISARAVRVYAVISGSAWQGNFAQIGHRRIAELACCSERLALDAVAELVKAGHLTKAASNRGQRAGYVLTSAVFGQKQRDGVKEIISSPRGGKRMVSVGAA